MRNVLKTAVYALFFCLDALRQGVAPRKRITILMYHSVGENDGKLNVKHEIFLQQARYLARHYHIVPLSDVVAYSKRELDLPDKSVAFTLDDGYADTYTKVFPVLKKHEIPMTVFLTTDFERKTGKWMSTPPTWEQVREMRESGLVTFEVHGHRHARLPDFAEDEQKLNDEIERCRDEIEKQLGYKSRFIAYPFGRHNSQVRDYVRRHGFEAGFGIDEGLVKKGDNLFTMKRIQVDRTMNFPLFKMRLTGAIDLNRRFVDFFRNRYAKK